MFRQHTLEITRLYRSDNKSLAGYQTHWLDRQKTGSSWDDKKHWSILVFHTVFYHVDSRLPLFVKIRNVGNFMVCRSYGQYTPPRLGKGRLRLLY